MKNRDLVRAEPDDRDLDIDPDHDLDIDGLEDGGDGGAFHDPVLRRALAHAPDHAVLPMDETRESILSFAHEAVAPSLPAAPPRNALQRLLGLRGGSGIGAIVPWNVVLALVVAGAVVVVRDGQETSDPAPGVVEASSPSPASSDATSKSTSAAAAAQTDTAVATTPAASAAPVPPVPAVEPPPAAQASVPASPTSDLLAFAAPTAESPADAAARLQLEQRLQRLEAAEARARLAQQTDAANVPTAPFPSALPRTAIPVEVPRGGRATATLAGTPAGAGAGATADRAADAPPPNFIALSQWTRLTITSSGGESWRVARADSRELGALVGSAALAGVSPQPLSGRVDWRIVFERNGEPLATLETAGSQIRWKENGMPAGTGTPSGNAMTSLRQALKEAQAEVAKATATPAAAVAPAVPVPPSATSSPQPEAALPAAAPAAAPTFEMPR
jgi:hypothetical protein